MIKDVKAWQEWEDRYNASQPVDYEHNLRLADAMLEHARALGVFPPKDPLEGIETKIQLARVLNCSQNSYKELPES